MHGDEHGKLFFTMITEAIEVREKMSESTGNHQPGPSWANNMISTYRGKDYFSRVDGVGSHAYSWTQNEINAAVNLQLSECQQGIT